MSTEWVPKGDTLASLIGPAPTEVTGFGALVTAYGAAR